jgi:hypothetical protein
MILGVAFPVAPSANARSTLFVASDTHTPAVGAALTVIV